tara:strand:+ start:39 stop:878 length:840 start_codon:yes stop_codon:yes gene_type:complete
LKTLTIIGGSGFVGKSLIDFSNKNSLLRWKINKLICISRKKIILKRKKNFTKIKYKIGDIKKLKKLNQSDLIIFAVNTNNKANDIKAAKKFVLLIKKLPKKTKILFTSSGAIYGKVKNKKKYAETKKIIENMFINLGLNGYNVSIARMFTFIGKRILNNKNYAISQFINSGLKKKLIEVKARSKIYRSYMHSDDMIRWILTILSKSSSKCPIYNVGSNESISIQNLAKLVGQILKTPVKIKKPSNKKIERYIPIIKKTQKELNLKLNYNLRTSIHSIIK